MTIDYAVSGKPQPVPQPSKFGEFVRDLKILLIEDSREDYQIFVRFLNKVELFSAETSWVQTLEAAKSFLKKETFDLIISDIGLPDCTGIESLKKIADVAQGQPIIILTGNEDESVLKEAGQLEIYDYLVKSDLSSRVLGRAIRYTLSRFESDRQRRTAETQLRRAQRVESIGKLAGGIAHDFNNKLAILSGAVQILLMNRDDPATFDRITESMDKTINKAANLTRQLLAFGRKQELLKKKVDLRKTLSDSCQILRRLIRSDITFETDFSNEALPAEVDEGQVDQVLMNLIINAQDAISDLSGKISVRAEMVKGRELAGAKLKGSADSKMVKITVEDTGCGMTDEQKEKAVEPFFTTKDIGKGTGLGLSVVDGIVNQHGGFLRIVDAQPRGTSMQIFLPAAEQLENKVEIDDKVVTSDHPSQTILYAEDEDQVRELIGALLEYKGFKVIYARDGEEALEMYNKQSSEIDVILTDVVMPKIGGRQLFEKIRKLSPNLGFVFMSGYSQTELTAGLGRLPINTKFHSKPCDIKDLCQSLSELAQNSTAGKTPAA